MTQNVSGWLPNLIGPVVLADEGVAVTARPTINFTGPGVVVTDNPVQNRTDVTVPSATFGTGVQSLPAVTSFVTTVDAKCVSASREPVHVQTMSLTTTTLDSFTLASGTVVMCTWTVVVIKSDSTVGGAWSISATFRNNAGTVSQLGATLVTAIGTPDDVSLVPTIDNSSTTIRLRVPGKAAVTMQYGATGSVVTVTP